MIPGCQHFNAIFAAALYKSYPFTAPTIMPDMKYRWTKGYTSTMGPIVMTQVASFTPSVGMEPTVKSVMASVRSDIILETICLSISCSGCSLVKSTSISPCHQSFQYARLTKSETEAITGLDSGRMICQKIRKSLAPSIRADSLISLGRE